MTYTKLKEYTDLEQSKVLKDILPIETADAYYYVMDQGLFLEVNDENPSEDDVPCWSLTALLNLFPDDYNIVFNRSFDENTKSTRWLCEACDGISITFKFSWCDDNLFDISYDSPIDACYNMICFLHKEGILNFNKDNN